MSSLYEKACNLEYLEKYSKNGNLLRTAEKYEKCWIIHQYNEKNNLKSGEYTLYEFQKIRTKYFSN